MNQYSLINMNTIIVRKVTNVNIYFLLNEEKLFVILEYMIHLDNNGFTFSKIVNDLMIQHHNSNTRIFKWLCLKFIQDVQNLLLSKLSLVIVSEFTSFMISVNESYQSRLKV